MGVPETLSPAVLANMESKNIDVDLSISVLDRFNRGEFDETEPVRVTGIPAVDGSTIIDFTGDVELLVRESDARRRLDGLVPGCALGRIGGGLGIAEENRVRFTRRDLISLGLLLMPRVSYGLLNGGSATSYADHTKNATFSAELLDLFAPHFDRMARASRDRAKGLTPAFLQPDGSFGPSFLQLKMRGLLILALRSRQALGQACPDDVGGLPAPLLPFFEMTSVHTHDQLRASYTEYRNDPLLADLIARTGLDPTDPLRAVQPLIAAYTHSEVGRPKQIFTHAYGREHETLALPGGHGQSFAVLAGVYRSLRDLGKRFVYLGNVDNLGYLPDPAEVAMLALTGRAAGFDFTFRTPVDVKGGILIRDGRGGLNCADIGPAVSRKDVARAEADGSHILFNAAIGLFDLDYLVPNIERISRDLPTRFTDQVKDAGRYSQAEQVTWEVLGMLDELLVFSVRKWDRFLAAKLLAETLMTSGLALDDPAYPTAADPAADLRGAAVQLHRGLEHMLSDTCGMVLANARWEPIPADAIPEWEGPS